MELDLFSLWGVEERGLIIHGDLLAWTEPEVLDTNQNAGNSDQMLGENPGTASPKELRILVFGGAHIPNSLNWTLLEQGFKPRVTVTFSCFTTPQFFPEKSIQWLKLLNSGFL